MINIRAQVDVVLPIKKTLPDSDMPLSYGAVEIKSGDGKRKYLLDARYSDYENPQDAGKSLRLSAGCYSDEINFPLSKEYPYDITFEDLEKGDCTASFYCSDVDMLAEDHFDFENALAHTTIYNFENSKTYLIKTTLER